MKRVHLLFVLLGLLAFSQPGFGQGSTTSTMNGKITNAAGEALGAATVIAIHTPTGSRYGAITSDQGYFRIPNMQVGGPYKVTVSYLGYADAEQNGVYLTLGQAQKLDLSLSEEASVLEEVLITSTAGDVFDGNRTGAETFISEEAIETLPTVSRDFLQDFGRLTPQANLINGGISIAGTNNRFNSIFIDGAVNNDVFGLANSGTNGGQAGISPISPDAIEQVQIVLAPYDITYGGFAGASVNAVTRSGTNNFEGSAYYFLRNENLSGKTPGADELFTGGTERTKLDPFTAQTYGFRIGGPLIKDKLFFFTNVEIQREEEPKPFDFATSGYVGDSDENDINNLISYLNSEYGYDPGGYKNNISTRDGEKILLKLDLNINDNNKASLRHSYVRGREIDTNRPNSRQINFFNSGVDFPSITNSTAFELKSAIGDNMANNLVLGYTSVRDDRDILGDPFPRVEVTDGNGLITFGTDAFSFSNIVNQDVFTLTNNFNLYSGRHNFTFGTHNEFFSIQNLFVAFSTPLYFYNSLQSFLDGDAAFSLFGHEQTVTGDVNDIRFGDEGERLGPTFKALQMAFYAQDEFQATDDLKLTFGLRFDIPVYLEDAPATNNDFNTRTVPLLEAAGYDLKGAQAGVLPKASVLISPRFGFNWDVGGTNTTQVRGGLGIFTSRIPWVWPGGVYIRTGTNAADGTGFGPFTPYPEDWRTRASTTSPSGDVDLYTEDFKYPQVFRTSLAIDQKIGGGFIANLEASFTKTINNIDVKSVNLKPSVESLAGADNRPIFDRRDEIDPTYSRITLVDNTNKGYTYNITAMLSRPFQNGFTANLAYSYTDGQALFDGTSFINASQWRGIHSVDGRNNAQVARSFFATGSRISAWVSKRFEYANNFATTVSLFYNGQDGGLFSYTYANGANLTNEDSRNRALIYVPASSNEIVFADEATAAAQWAALDAFIENDDYLSTRRGDYAERNGRRTPFEHIFDLKILQDVSFDIAGKRQTVQLTFDLFNVGNFLNAEWGKDYFVGNDGNVEIVRFEGFADGTTNQPTFSFRDPGDSDVWDLSLSGLRSARWSSQFGVRYSF